MPDKPIAVVTGKNNLTLDPSTLISILWAEIAEANHPEALGGYFDHLMDSDVIAAVKAYAYPIPHDTTFEKHGEDD